jgi:hypothetical protein
MSKMTTDERTVFDLSDLELKVANHLNVSPNPSDEEFHRWAERQDIEVEEAEKAAYKLATLCVQFLYGGRANEKGISTGDVDKKELEMGINVEFEHTPNRQMASRITLDHEAEFPLDVPLKYYPALKLMERLIKALAGMDKQGANEKIRQLVGLVESAEGAKE